MKTFSQWIMEGRSFEYQGSKYSSGFGRYTKDGESISREEYMKASDAYKDKDSSVNETNYIPEEFYNYKFSEKTRDALDYFLADDTRNTTLRKFLEKKTKINLTGNERLYKWCHSSPSNDIRGVGRYGMYCVHFLIENEKRLRFLKHSLKRENIDVDDYISTMTKKLQDYTKNASMIIRCRANVLFDILKDKRFKTQYETGTSGGSVDISGRSNIELMGQNISYDIDVDKRPIYGCLKQRNEDGSVNIKEYGLDKHYGECICVLKDNLRKSTTVTFGDSKDSKIYSSPLDNPNFKSFLAFQFVLDNYKELTNKDISQFFEIGELQYPEIQIHDEVTTQDIDYVIITTGKRKKSTKLLISKLEEAGIKCVVQEETK